MATHGSPTRSLAATEQRARRTYPTRHLRTKGKSAAHLGVDGDDVEHAEDDEGGEAVDGDEDVPRRASTARGRFNAPRPELQEENAQKGVQKDGNERTASIDDGRRRILEDSPSAMAEQGRLWREMAAAAKGKEGRNGTLGSGGVSGCA